MICLNNLFCNCLNLATSSTYSYPTIIPPPPHQQQHHQQHPHHQQQHHHQQQVHQHHQQQHHQQNQLSSELPSMGNWHDAMSAPPIQADVKRKSIKIS